MFSECNSVRVTMLLSLLVVLWSLPLFLGLGQFSHGNFNCTFRPYKNKKGHITTKIISLMQNFWLSFRVKKIVQTTYRSMR